MKLIVEHYKDRTNQHLATVLMTGSNVIKTVIELSRNIHTYIHTYTHTYIHTYSFIYIG